MPVGLDVRDAVAAAEGVQADGERVGGQAHVGQGAPGRAGSAAPLAAEVPVLPHHAQPRPMRNAKAAHVPGREAERPGTDGETETVTVDVDAFTQAA